MQRHNRLLSLFPQPDRESLRLRLRPIFLEQKTVLFGAGEVIGRVYFPLDAIVSFVVDLSTGEMVEAAMIGNDGAVGAHAAIDGRTSLNRAVVQLAGDALVCDVDDLRNVVAQSPALLKLLIRNEQAVYVQAQQSAACIAAHQIEARLSRWLLRARDLAGRDTLQFTQEFLAEMLGVRRSSVSLVAHTLQKAGLIQYSRGRIKIVDLIGLRETSCECFGAIHAHYNKLFDIPVGS